MIAIHIFTKLYFRVFHESTYIFTRNRTAAGAESISVCFSVEAMVIHHACKDVWDATISEELSYQSEHGNAQDVFALCSSCVERRSYCWSHPTKNIRCVLDVSALRRLSTVPGHRVHASTIRRIYRKVAGEFCAFCTSLEVLKTLLRSKNSLHTLKITCAQQVPTCKDLWWKNFSQVGASSQKHRIIVLAKVSCYTVSAQVKGHRANHKEVIQVT